MEIWSPQDGEDIYFELLFLLLLLLLLLLRHGRSQHPRRKFSEDIQTSSLRKHEIRIAFSHLLELALRNSSSDLLAGILLIVCTMKSVIPFSACTDI